MFVSMTPAYAAEETENIENEAASETLVIETVSSEETAAEEAGSLIVETEETGNPEEENNPENGAGISPAYDSLQEELQAEEDEAAADEDMLYGVIETVYNPLYPDLPHDEEVPVSGAPMLFAAAPVLQSALGEVFSTKAEMVAYIRQQLVNRSNSFTASILLDEDSKSINGSALFSEYLSEAMEHTGIGNEGDYIKWHYKTSGGTFSILGRDSETGLNTLTITYNMTYYTSAAEEAQVTAAVNAIESWIMSAVSDELSRIELAYYFITQNVTYDYDNLYDSSYTYKYTAYACLNDGTAVCQGYANLFYRLMLDMGIDCRIIAGEANEGNHGWNIVKCGNKYYNVDSTWDASNIARTGSAAWFMKDNDDSVFAYYHSRWSAYTTPEFMASYPMTSSDMSFTAEDCANSETGHMDVTYGAEPATCTVDGKTGATRCWICSTLLSASRTITAPGHTRVVDDAVAPTCLDNGLTEGAHCKICGEIITAQTILPATGHTIITQEAVAPTGHSVGYTEGSYCDVCHEVFQARTEIPELENPEAIINLAEDETVDEAYIDGIKVPVYTEENTAYAVAEVGQTEAKVLTQYNRAGNSGNLHGQYPDGMTVRFMEYAPETGDYDTEKQAALENVLQYGGCSIRINGENNGIRMITSVTASALEILKNNGLNGYMLAEYGTVVGWLGKVSPDNLTLNSEGAMHASAYCSATGQDAVYSSLDGLVSYTNVLVGFSDAQCSRDLVMRPYMKLSDGTDEIVIYGGAVCRSIGYVAYQNRNAFDAGTDAYEYIWRIIHAAYGSTYDAEYVNTAA